MPPETASPQANDKPWREVDEPVSDVSQEELAQDKPWRHLDEPLTEPASSMGAGQAFTTGVAGGTLKMALPVVGGFLGAAAGPAGVAGGIGLGYLAGQQLDKIGQQVPLPGGGTFTADEDDIPAELRPYYYAGESLGGSMMGTAGLGAVASTGARLPTTLVGRWINRSLDFSARRPIVHGVTETGSALGAATAAGVSEAYLPGDDLARGGAEFAGGLFSPTKKAVVLGNYGFDLVSKLRSAFSTGGQQTRAAARINEIIDIADGDRDTFIELMAREDVLGLDRSAGQKTGHSAIISLERRLAQEDPKFAKSLDEKAVKSLAAIENMILMLQKTGNPMALKEAARLKEMQFNMETQGRIDAAESEAFKQVGKITEDTPEVREELARAGRKALGDSLKMARAKEVELWSKVPQDQPAGMENLFRKFDEIKAERLPVAHNLPEVIEKNIQLFRARAHPEVDLGDEAEIITTRDLTNMRSALLELARETDSFNEARIYGTLAEAARNDLDALNLPGSLEARQFSKVLHDAYSRSFAGRVIGTNSMGGDRLPPESMLKSAFAGGKEIGALRLRELREATRFMEAQGYDSPEAAQAFTQMLDAQKRYVMLAAAEAVDPSTGVVSRTRLTKFARDNQVLLKELGIEKDVEAALESSESAAAYVRRITEGRGIAEKSAAFAKVLKFENAVDGLTGALDGANPVRDFDGIAKIAKGGGKPAIDGMAAATFDYAIRMATNKTGQLSVEGFEKALFDPIRAGQPSVADIMLKRGIFSKDQVNHARLLIDEWKQVEGTRSALTSLDQAVPGESLVLDLLARVAGAKAGSALAGVGGGEGGGHTLIAAGRGSHFGRQIVERIPQLKTRTFLGEMLLDPKFGAAMLQKPKSLAEAFKLAQRAWGYAAQAGLTAAEGVTDGTEEPANRPLDNGDAPWRGKDERFKEDVDRKKSPTKVEPIKPLPMPTNRDRAIKRADEWPQDTARERFTPEETKLLLEDRGWDALPETQKNPEIYAELSRMTNRSAVIAMGMDLAKMNVDSEFYGSDKNAITTGTYSPKNDEVRLPGVKGEKFNPVAAAHEFAHRGISELAKIAKQRLAEKDKKYSFPQLMAAQLLAGLGNGEERIARLIEANITGKPIDPDIKAYFGLDNPEQAERSKLLLEMVEEFAQEEVKRRKPGGPR
jgi:hypothetical protein